MRADPKQTDCKPPSLARQPKWVANRSRTLAAKPQPLAPQAQTFASKLRTFVILNSSFVIAMFDPTLPQEGTPLDAVQMRSQLNGLKALMDALVTVSDAQVDSTTTLPPGSPATAGVNVIGSTLHITFAIPQGETGPAGTAGDPGAPGQPFATAVVDSVTTLNPGEAATVGVSFDGTNVRFTFAIPRGVDGTNGTDGEVTAAALAAAITTTSSNTNNVTTLGQSAEGNYNPTQMQDVLSKLDELITALRR